MNKHAQLGDQMYLIYFVFLLLIITVGIVAGSYSAFGKPYDSRDVDSALLMNKVVSCLENTPALTEVKIRSVLTKCEIDQDTLEKGYILSVSIKDKEVFKFGDSIVCGLQDKYPKGPKCSYTSLRISVDNSIKEVSIIAGSSLQ
jgi:hypothetical protein